MLDKIFVCASMERSNSADPRFEEGRLSHLQPTAFDTAPCTTGTALVHLSSSFMQEGTIARLTDRGFGFISIEGQEKDLFFHSKELVGVSFDDLREGDKVTFELADSPKGPNAIKVSKIS